MLSFKHSLYGDAPGVTDTTCNRVLKCHSYTLTLARKKKCQQCPLFIRRLANFLSKFKAFICEITHKRRTFEYDIYPLIINQTSTTGEAFLLITTCF